MLVVNGDLPHVDPDTMRAPRQEHVLRDASATVLAFFADPRGRIVRDARRRLPPDRGGARRLPEEREIAEGTGGSTCSAPRARRAGSRLGTANAQGERYQPTSSR